MKTFQVSCTGGSLHISKLIFGTTYLGNMDHPEEGYRQMDRYLELGGNCIDTARVYSNLAPEDKRPSEEVIGDWMRHSGIRRQVILSTKGGHPPYGKMKESRLNAKELEYDLSQSLTALNTDYVDLYWLHRDHPDCCLPEVMETLHSFVKQGMVKTIGASNWSFERIKEANQYAVEHGLTPFTSSQIQWSLATTTPESLHDDTLVCVNEQNYAQYLTQGMPLFAFNAQAKGLFSKLAEGEQALTPKIKTRFLGEENREINLRKWEKVQQLCKKYGVSPAVISLAYITCNPLTAGAIIGCSTLAQLEDSMGAADFELTPEEINWLGE
ncbi:MAG: aldo/keto reductase [Massiliimalia sp.]|jgi:aryl-alcohol dehydrogenase-like predicted oxidoreductase